MTNRELFIKAHAMTKKILRTGDDYRITFGACVKYILTKAPNTVKFSSLPSFIQSEVLDVITEDRKLIISEKVRYFKNHGFSSASAYYDKLVAEFKPTADHIKAALNSVMFSRFKKNGYNMEEWMGFVPNAQASLKIEMNGRAG